MPDDVLADYIPSVGDRIAAKLFIHRTSPATNKSKRHSAFVQKITKKLKLKSLSKKKTEKIGQVLDEVKTETKQLEEHEDSKKFKSQNAWKKDEDWSRNENVWKKDKTSENVWKEDAGRSENGKEDRRRSENVWKGDGRKSENVWKEDRRRSENVWKEDGHRNQNTWKKERDARQNAWRKDRTVSFGWLHMEGGNYRQVYKSNGGGCYTKSILKSTNKQEMIQLAKQIYFPNGKSTKGPESEFEFEMFMSRQENPLPENFKLGDLCRGQGQLRFYLASQPKCSEEEEEYNSEFDVSTLPVDSEASNVTVGSNVTCGTAAYQVYLLLDAIKLALS